MTNSEQAIREIAEKHFPCVGTRNDREYRKMEQDALVSSITALISEHCVAKAAYIALENTLAKAEAKNLELLQQRDELKKENEKLKRQIQSYNPYPNRPNPRDINPYDIGSVKRARRGR